MQESVMPGAALKLPTVLSLTALTIAVLQGVIGLESSRPARLSMRKAKILLIMQVLLLPVIAAAEVVTFLDARAGLSRALSNLRWVPYVLVGLGFVAYTQDLLYTLYAVCSSRIYWIPLCDSRRGKGRFVEAIPLVIASILVTILVCWRQKWGFSEVLVKQGGATRLLGGSLVALSAIVASVGSLLATIIALALLRKNSTGNVFSDLLNLRNARENRQQAMDFKSSGARNRDLVGHIDQRRTKAQLEYLVEIQRDVEGLNQLRQMDYDAFLHYTPLHVRNLIVGEDQFFILPSRAPFRLGKDTKWNVFEVLSLVQIFSIVPLLVVVVAAMFRLHNDFSANLFFAFKELVDIVLVYSSLNISFGLKRLLWSFSGCYKAEMNGDLEMDQNMRYVESPLQDCGTVNSDAGLSEM